MKGLKINLLVYYSPLDKVWFAEATSESHSKIGIYISALGKSKKSAIAQFKRAVGATVKATEKIYGKKN